MTAWDDYLDWMLTPPDLFSDVLTIEAQWWDAPRSCGCRWHNSSHAYVADQLGSALCRLDADEFTIDDCSTDGSSSIELAGETREGLRFVAHVRVETIEHGDF